MPWLKTSIAVKSKEHIESTNRMEMILRYVSKLSLNHGFAFTHNTEPNENALDEKKKQGDGKPNSLNREQLQKMTLTCHLDCMPWYCGFILYDLALYKNKSFGLEPIRLNCSNDAYVRII